MVTYPHQIDTIVQNTQRHNLTSKIRLIEQLVEKLKIAFLALTTDCARDGSSSLTMNYVEQYVCA